MDRDEERWIAQARRGDQEAFACLVRRYEKRIYGLTLRMCSLPALAEEAAQEAFLSAWQGLAFFRERAAFSTWLYRLAVNASVDLLRKEGRHALPSLDEGDVGLTVPDPAPTPQEQAEAGELRRCIEAGLRQLSPEYRAVLVLREIQQLSYDEIARALELDLGTVKSRISRGRRHLREFLCQTGNFSSPGASKKTGKGAGR